MNGKPHPSDCTPRWQELRDGHPEAHEFLSALARAVYEKGEEPVPLSSLNETGVEAAEKEGSINRSEDELRFANEEVRHDYLVHHGAKLLLKHWNGTEAESFAEEFANVIAPIARFAGTRIDIGAMMLRVLFETHDIDVLSITSNLAELDLEQGGEEEFGGRSLFWNLYGPFCDALPHLEIKTKRLAEEIGQIVEASSGDGTGGRIHSAIEEKARQSAEKADALYIAFVSRPDSAAVSLAANALIGLSAFDFVEAHRRAMHLTEEERPITRRVGMAALGRMPYDAEHASLLQDTWRGMEELRTKPDEETDYVLVRTYGDLLNAAENIWQGREAGSPDIDAIGVALAEMTSRADSRVRHMAAKTLFLKGKEYCARDWYERALLRLAGVPSVQTGTLRYIDYCASQYLKSDSPDADKAVTFLRAFVLERPDDGDAHELLGSTFSVLLESHFAELQAELTRWLASPESKLHWGAANTYRHFKMADVSGETGLRPWLSKEVLDVLSEREVLWVVQRTCGYVGGGGELLANLMLSVLHREPVSEDLAQFVANMMSDYVLYNYPRGGRKAIERCLGEDGVPDIAKAKARVALDKSERYYERLRDLPALKEFQPPSSRVYRLRRAQHKQRSEMMERANAQSDFLSLISRLPLKYGRAFFSERNGDEFSEPSHLSSFSQSAELPRGEFTDPVGQIYQRLMWRQAGPGETNEQENTSGAEEPGDETK